MYWKYAQICYQNQRYHRFYGNFDINKTHTIKKFNLYVTTWAKLKMSKLCVYAYKIYSRLKLIKKSTIPTSRINQIPSLIFLPTITFKFCSTPAYLMENVQEKLKRFSISLAISSENKTLEVRRTSNVIKPKCFHKFL